MRWVSNINIYLCHECFIWKYLRKRNNCPLNKKMENQRLPLLLKLSSESIVKALRKFLFPSLRLSQAPESFLLSVSSVTAFSLLGKSTHCEKICADNTTRIHLSRFTAFIVVKNVQIQAGGVHAVHARTKGGCWNLTFDSEDSPYIPASNIASSHILHKSVHVATNHC